MPVISLLKNWAIFYRDLVGFSTKLICVIDGDVKDKVKGHIAKNKDYENIPVLFLPIPSVEKYLHKRILADGDRKFSKEFGDKYLSVKSLSSIVNDFSSKYPNYKDESLNKRFYDAILMEIASNGVKEEAFLENLSEGIYGMANFDKFRAGLKQKIPY